MQSVIKAKKNQLKLFGVLKIVAFVFILAFLFYRFYYSDSIKWNSPDLSSLWSLYIAVMLVPLNWFLEFTKWNLTTQLVKEDISNRDKNNSFLAGMITGILSPNMIGNFIGRIYYFERKDRILITLLTLVSNQAQFIITLLMGILSLVFIPLKSSGFTMDLYKWVVVGFVVTICFVGYFYFERVLQVFTRTKKIGLRLELIFSEPTFFRLKILVLSFLRYLVFLIQFILMLVTFGVDFDLLLPFKIAQVYLISSLLPTLMLGKFGVRESVGIIILGSIGIAELTVLISSLSIWLLNLVLPTLMALLLLKRRLD